MKMESMYEQLGVSAAVYEYGERIIAELRDRFDAIDQTAEYNQAKVLSAMQKNRVNATHFAATTGYGYDDEGRDTLHLGDGEDTVDQERLRHWDSAGGQHDKLVDVGDRRADERVFPGQKFLQNALIALSGNADKIADEGRLVLSPEASSGAAFDNAIFRLYIIEAAQGFDDAILFHALTQTGSAANRRSRRRGRRRPGACPCL